MSLSDVSIKNPVFAWMLMAGLILFGLIGFFSLGVSELPEIDFPVVTVSIDWEGAAPEVMESDVVDVVEDAVMSTQDINEVSSTTRQGHCEIMLEFDLNRDIDAALQEVQTKITQAQQRLPKEIDPPVISKMNPMDQPILWLGVRSDGPLRELMAYMQDTLKDRFQTIPGVGDIVLGGYVERNLRIWISTQKLQEYELTVTDVIDAINAGHEEMPAGRIETPIKEMNVRTMGEARTVEQFEQIVIGRRAKMPVYKPIYLKDIATIEDGLADIRRIARIEGQTAGGLGIRKQKGANAVEVAHRVKKRLKEVQKDLPKGMAIGVNFDSTKFVEDAVGELVFTLILSALLTGLVCWAFLGSWSSTINILLSIPTSIIGTFLVFKFMNFTLNTFTLLGLSLAIGIVVDDAIMVLENIVRHREQGMSRVDAAAVGARQITFAALAATLALIAIFLPVVFMKGPVGKFFFQFGITISTAVAFSLLAALTLTPMAASQFLEVKKRHSGFGKAIDDSFKKLADKYHKGLIYCLKIRGRVLLGSLILFFASSALFVFLRKEFVPAQDQSIFLCKIKTPVASSLEFTSNKLKEAEERIKKFPEIDRYFCLIGGFSGGETNTGMLVVTLKDKHRRGKRQGIGHVMTQQEIMDQFRKEMGQIPEVTAYIQDLSMRGFTAQRGFPIEFTVRGQNWEKLGEYSQKVMDEMLKTNLMVDVDTDYLLGVKEVQIVPNRQKAYQYGVDMSTMGTTVNALIGGQRVGKYTSNGRRYDNRVQLFSNERADANTVNNFYLWNNRGELVRLSDVVDVKYEPSLLSITRRGRERAIGIFANVAKGKSQSDALGAVERIAKQVLPEGYRVVFSGSSQVAKDSAGSFMFALILGILVAYMILASQFNSYIHPITVILALPFSITGAGFALFISNQSLNLYSCIGLLLLMGIVKKNSILLVEFTNQVREEGKKVDEALLIACPIRLRPILMTSIATVVAAIPPAMALGPGAETRIPMAVSVIGGVSVSTFLTLFVVPCAYSLFSRFERAASPHAKHQG